MTRPLPSSLLRYTATQDYSRYDAADQATWRFVMLHLYEHLRHAAHDSYVKGLRSSALSTERIPKIDEMDAALGEVGWGAVCVDGFIPPRAFQRFQALGILPIAADIRTPQHVAYTPAPDILHEAAGHAPILADRDYAEYLKGAGRIGELAFSSPEDQAVYEAVTRLSAVKETTPEGSTEIAAAQRRLERAVAEQTVVTESARMARLYWWTAEYGLIGNERSYKLYGAGLLSSLGEAVFCLDDNVRKLPLSIECLEYGYDITRPQPQLFVTPSFASLFDVLKEAEQSLAVNQGVPVALEAARASRLPAWVEWGGGFGSRGTLRAVGYDAGRPVWLQLEQAVMQSCQEQSAVSLPGARSLDWMRDALDPEVWDRIRMPRDLLVPLGPPISDPGWRRVERAQRPASVVIRYASGLRVQGMLHRCIAHEGTSFAVFRELAVTGVGEPRRFEWVVLPLDAQVTRVLPAEDEGTLDDVPRVAPAPRTLSPRERTLRDLFEQAYGAWRTLGGKEAADALLSVHRTLQREFPEEWLLRWNLLESLLKLGEVERSQNLVDELESLELRYRQREPIATGLRSLRSLAGAANDVLQGVS